MNYLCLIPLSTIVEVTQKKFVFNTTFNNCRIHRFIHYRQFVLREYISQSNFISKTLPWMRDAMRLLYIVQNK
jgi:hypothetical protein